jgi:hypothetical protein
MIQVITNIAVPGSKPTSYTTSDSGVIRVEALVLNLSSKNISDAIAFMVISKAVIAKISVIILLLYLNHVKRRRHSTPIRNAATP